MKELILKKKMKKKNENIIRIKSQRWKFISYSHFLKYNPWKFLFLISLREFFPNSIEA